MWEGWGLPHPLGFNSDPAFRCLLKQVFFSFYMVSLLGVNFALNSTDWFFCARSRPVIVYEAAIG